jgi:hypothetical protein
LTSVDTCTITMLIDVYSLWLLHASHWRHQMD